MPDSTPSKSTKLLLIAETDGERCGEGCSWLALSGDLCHLFYELLSHGSQTRRPLRCSACHDAERAAKGVVMWP